MSKIVFEDRKEKNVGIFIAGDFCKIEDAWPYVELSSPIVSIGYRSPKSSLVLPSVYDYYYYCYYYYTIIVNI